MRFFLILTYKAPAFWLPYSTIMFFSYILSYFICRQPIKCGQTVRLLHLNTNRNLHSHHFQSPLSRNLEVTAFGENGEGDEGQY